jgi:hypothetical protein
MQPLSWAKIHRMLLSAASRASEASVADFSNKNTALALSIDKKKRPQLQLFEKYQASLLKKWNPFAALPSINIE